MFNSIYKFPAYRFDVHERLHQQDPHRRLPRRRPAGGDVRHRADRWTSWPPSWARTVGAARQNWIKHEEFPFTTVGGLDYDSGNYEAATAKARSCSATTSCAREQRSAGRATTRSSWASASPPTPRCAGWRRPGCSGRCATAPAAGSPRHPDAAHRQGRGGHRPSRARPGPRDRVEPDRRRPARGARSRTSRCCTATPRSRPRAWTPTARGRWSSAAIAVVKAAEKVSRRPARSPRTCSRRPRTTWSSPAAGSGSRHRQGRGIGEVAFATFQAHDLPDGIEPSLDSDATYDPEAF